MGFKSGHDKRSGVDPGVGHNCLSVRLIQEYMDGKQVFVDIRTYFRMGKVI
jgi:hypothetical protein